MKLYLLTALLGGLLIAAMVVLSPLRAVATPWRLAMGAYLLYGVTAGIKGLCGLFGGRR